MSSPAWPLRERPARLSNALRWPVLAPRGTVYLTTLQWTLWWYLRRPRSTRRTRVTLETLSALTGSSRGRVWHALARLRSLELIGWRAWPSMPVDSDRKWHGQLVKVRRQSPGCRGHLLVWIPAKTRAAFAGALGARLRTPIDSVSGSYGAYVSARGTRGAVDTWTRKRQPPAAGDRYARAGPHRGRPPAVVYARCPAGHSTRLGRTSWIEGPPWNPYLEARFVGACRRCRAEVVESISIALPAPPPRGLSAGELVDPELRDRRRSTALALLDDPSTPRILAERIRRDYLDPAGAGSERYRSPVELEPAGLIAAELVDGLRRSASVRSPGPDAIARGSLGTRDPLGGSYVETQGHGDRADDDERRAAPERGAPGKERGGTARPLGGVHPGAASSSDGEPGAIADAGRQDEST